METEKTIFLIRHFATEYNYNGIFMGRSIDPSIIEKNIPNPGKFKKIFSGKCRVYTSPSKRCLQTSSHILSSLPKNSIESLIEESFSEINYGDFEGKNIGEIAKRFPKEYNDLINNPALITFPNGDNLIKRINEAYNKMEKIFASKDVDTIIIVSHVDIIKGIVFKSLGIDYNKKKYVRLDNGSITKMDYFAEGYRLCYLNKIL